MQKAVQNTAARLLTIIGISGPTLSNTGPVPEGCLSRIRFTYHKIISVPVIHPAVVLEVGDSQGGPQPDGSVMHYHEPGLMREVPRMRNLYFYYYSLNEN